MWKFSIGKYSSMVKIIDRKIFTNVKIVSRKIFTKKCSTKFSPTRKFSKKIFTNGKFF